MKVSRWWHLSKMRGGSKLSGYREEASFRQREWLVKRPGGVKDLGEL